MTPRRRTTLRSVSTVPSAKASTMLPPTYVESERPVAMPVDGDDFLAHKLEADTLRTEHEVWTEECSSHSRIKALVDDVVLGPTIRSPAARRAV